MLDSSFYFNDHDTKQLLFSESVYVYLCHFFPPTGISRHILNQHLNLREYLSVCLVEMIAKQQIDGLKFMEYEQQTYCA